MAPVNDLVNLANTGQAAALVGHNIGVVKKKKVTTKDILGLGVTNIFGASVIKTTADIGAGI